MLKMQERPPQPENPDIIRRLLASRAFLLGDLVLVLLLAVVWVQTDGARPIVFLFILATLVVAYIELYRRDTRWVWRLSDLNTELRRALAESDTLAEISKEFSGEVQLDALFDLVARRARELLGADYATVAIVEESTGDTVWVAATGLNSSEPWTHAMEPGRGLTGRAISAGQPTLVEDFGKNPAFPVDEYPLHKAEGMIAALVMPMLRGSKVLGALTIGFRRLHHFSDEELVSMEALAAQAGVALENAQLYRQEQRRVAELEAVLDHMSEGVIVTDGSGRIVRRNEAAVQLLGDLRPGASLSEADSLADLQISGPEGVPLLAGEWPVARAARGEEFMGQEVTVRRGDAKPRHITVDGRPVLNAKGEAVLGVIVIHDITSMREMDQLKDEFLSLAAHELKTPLTSLKGYAQMLLSSSGEPIGEPRRRALEVMDKQVNRVNHVVEQFLLVEEIRSGRLMLRPEQVDLAEAVTAACERGRESGGGHAVECKIAGSLLVNVDAKSLSLVLSSLLDNAIKFSPQGAAVDVTASTDGGNAVVCVRDRGVGIPKDKQGYIFERFYQVQPGTQRGIGLGLFICQELVSRHGGRMWLESEEGEGSSFYFSLPLAEPRRRRRAG